MSDEPMDVNSREAALWSETMSLKSRNEWLESEIERLTAELSEWRALGEKLPQLRKEMRSEDN